MNTKNILDGHKILLLGTKMFLIDTKKSVASPKLFSITNEQVISSNKISNHSKCTLTQKWIKVVSAIAHTCNDWDYKACGKTALSI